jgi:hypothetical protein
MHSDYFRHHYNAPLALRFWSKVKKSNDCWTWTAAKVRGYGIIRIAGKDYRAHRVSWELSYGPIPAGMFVCHRCDNPSCVRPDHLFLGTPMDNQVDARQKGRLKRARGERHGMSRLSDETMKAIVHEYLDGEISQSELAKKYGVCQHTVSHHVLRARSGDEFYRAG